MKFTARHYQTGTAVELCCSGPVIESVRPAADPGPESGLGWVAPALFDLQINGCHGISFNSARLTAADVRHVVEVSRRHGIGGLCPTLVTASFESLSHGFRTLAAACDADPELGEALPVFHLEGPYISPVDGPRGAHPAKHVRPPDWDEFRRLQDASGGRVRLVTLAPEHDGALGFIEKLTRTGVVVAIGHTAADGPRLRAAVTAGARLSTHLGNGSHAELPRHDNYVWEQLAHDGLWASLITDGHHLPAAVIKCMIRVKTPARTVITSDAGPLAAAPPGRYRLWDQDFDVLPGGKIMVSGTDRLGGSWCFTDDCLGVAVRSAGVTLAEAIDMASARPRDLLRLPACPLTPGTPADFMVFDRLPGDDVRITRTVVGGVVKFDQADAR